MKNSITLITNFSIIVLMLLSISDGYTNPCTTVGTLRYSVLTERQESVLSLAFNPQHNDILAVGRSKITTASDNTIEYDGTIELWNISTGKLLHTLSGHTDAVFALAFSPNGNILASGSADGTVRLWNTIDIGNQTRIEELQDPFTGHTDLVLSLTFSADGKTLASGSRDGTLWLWNLSDLNKIEQHNIFPGTPLPPVLSLAFSPIESPPMLATARADTVIRVWNLRTGELMHAFRGHEDLVTSLAFNADGSLLASGSADNTVQLWDTSAIISTGKSLHEFTEHEDWVNSVAFHETTLASAGFDNTIFLWEAGTKDLLHELSGHAGSIESIAFSSDGNILASGGHDGKVLLWELTPQQIGADINGDGFVNLVDLTLVDSHLGTTGQNIPDVNGDDTVNIADLVWVTNAIEATAAERNACVSERTDVNNDNVVDRQDLVAVDSRLGMIGQYREDVNIDGIVNIIDLVLVANAIDIEAASAPSLHNRATALITAEQVQGWLTEARLSGETSFAFQRGILVLEQLSAMLTPKTTALLPNYPNPFNPETWIPYRLEQPADVTVTIYAANGTLVRTLQLGHQPAGTYESRTRAAYWNGKNEFGEPVASGLYFYTLTAGTFTATRKMLIRK